MQYDFTSIMERHGLDAIAVDAPPRKPAGQFDLIPMWVADMNFPTVPTIPQAIIARASHPAYGYFMPREEYYEGIFSWQRRHNGADGLQKENILYANGVLGGVNTALSVLCSKGDSVLVHSPTYVGFTHVLENNGYHIVHSPLHVDNGVWRMDFADMEEKIAREHIHAAIFCSPHNPCGRVWEKWEVEQAMALFRKYDVRVISDEIWSDLLLFGNKHIPTQSVSEDAKMRTVAMYAPSKTFNLAGLVGSYAICYDPWLRDRMEKEASLCHYNSMNLLSMYAQIGAYTPEGEEWLKQLLEVLSGNVRFAVDFINERLPGVRVTCPQGTYMLFPDCSDWCRTTGKTIDELLDKCYAVDVAVQDGRHFGGTHSLRLNLASPRSRIEQAMERLEKYVLSS